MQITRRGVIAGAAAGGATAALGIPPAVPAVDTAWTVYHEAQNGGVTCFSNVASIEGFESVAFVGDDGRWVYLSRGTMWADLNGRPIIGRRRIVTHPYALDV